MPRPSPHGHHDLRLPPLSSIMLLRESGFVTKVATNSDSCNTTYHYHLGVPSMSRSLSALGAKLILHLEWEEQPVVTIKETMDILDSSYDRARQVIHRLVRDMWLAPITRPVRASR